MMKSRCLQSVAVVSLVASLCVAAGNSPSFDSKKIDEFVLAEMQRQNVPGTAVGIVRNGVVVKAEGYGFANLEHRVPVGHDTIFQSGSVGKQFTATAVMLLVEEGKLSLSDPVSRFFEGAPGSWESITVAHLLTHTSGIPDYNEDVLNYRQDYTEEELAIRAFSLEPEFPAGARWNYSNTGYVLLGIIVHRVSGSFYGDVLAERIFRPLGMSTVRIISESDVVPNRAAGYRLEEGEIKNQEWVAPSLNTTADGSLYLSVKDLIAWDVGLRSHAILSAQSWDRVFQPVRLNSGKTYPYGFGWSVEQRGGRPLHHHSGSWQGFKAHFARFIGDDLSLIVLCNLAQAAPQRFIDGIAGIINPELGAPRFEPVEDRDPQITARLIDLLEKARAGTLSPGEFAYLRAGFLPVWADAIRKQLRQLGPHQRLVLVRQAELGDDRVFTYRVWFQGKTMFCTLGLVPDGRISILSLDDE